MDSRKGRLKLALIAFSFSLAGLAVVYHLVYPLSITGEEGYLLQIPPVFWVLITVSLASLFAIALLTRSPLVTLGSIVATALVLNFHNFLIYSVNGRDTRGEVSRLFFSLGQTHLGIDLYNYFQWPVHFVVIQQTDRIVSLSLGDMIWNGYVAFYVLFAVGIGVFAYSYTNRETFPWFAAAVFYIIFTRQWLNNQLVPQFTALIILLFLFSIHDVRDTRLRVLRGVLYLALVLAHPFFFSFYLLYVIATPIVRTSLETIGTVGTPDRSIVYQTLQAVRHAPRTLGTFRSNLDRNIGISWFNYITFLVISYLSFFLLRFTIFNEQLFALLSVERESGASENIPSRVAELLFGTSRFSGAESEVGEVLLFDLVPSVLKDVTLYGTIGVVLTLVVVSAVALLVKPSSRISPYGISVVIAGLIYYVVGFALPILGNRAFQVFLLPLGTFLDGDYDYQKVVKVVVLVVLVASPVVVANFMTNYSLQAGGNSHDYHGDEAGRFLLEYSNLERDGAVVYPSAGFPPVLTKSGEELPITTLEGIITSEADTSETIVYGDWQEHEARYYNHSCNFDPVRRNAVYDNRVRVLTDSFVSEPFVCSERESILTTTQ